MLRVQVDFRHKLREWDGFGVNYVETSQTRDYQAEPQDYGGFGTLSQQDREAILDLVFGPNGLKPGVVKMFLDPFHQARPSQDYDWSPDTIDLDAYDHLSTTHWMRYFVSEGLARTRAWGGDLQIVVTLYGPPAWMTRQGFLRGRDLAPRHRTECAKYMISWAKYLREQEGLPVRYISLHNEGEDWERWPIDGSGPGSAGHDYNLYWSPEQVAEFCAFMPDMLRANGMADVGVTPGETTNWYRFSEWGYADAVADDPRALRELGLITSHGFASSGPDSRWYGDWRSLGADVLRGQRPELHSWVTSASWGAMDVFFVNELRHNIYMAKANAIIPWACIQQEGRWVGGDPNPGCAFKVSGGSYRVLPGYDYYKQVTRAGQPGTALARVTANDSVVGLIAFAGNLSGHPDAFVVLNMAAETRQLPIEVLGTSAAQFRAFRTADGERYRALGTVRRVRDLIRYEAPPRSVTTFIAGAS